MEIVKCLDELLSGQCVGLIADWVIPVSVAAAVKLPQRAADSKALTHSRGGCLNCGFDISYSHTQLGNV